MPVPDYFPGGTMKPVSDAAHAAGMDFMLWFEPERIAMNYVQRVCPVSPSDCTSFLLFEGNPCRVC